MIINIISMSLEPNSIQIAQTINFSEVELTVWVRWLGFYDFITSMISSIITLKKRENTAFLNSPG